jgi:hypothetical protein
MHQTRRNSVIRLVAVNAGMGIIIGLACAAALLATDYRGIWSLVEKTDAEIPAVALLFSGFAVTFGSVVCGSAIMALGGQGPGDTDRRMPWRLSLVRESLAKTSKHLGFGNDRWR